MGLSRQEVLADIHKTSAEPGCELREIVLSLILQRAFAPPLIELSVEKIYLLYLFLRIVLMLFQARIFVVEKLQALLPTLKILVDLECELGVSFWLPLEL